MRRYSTALSSGACCAAAPSLSITVKTSVSIALVLLGGISGPGTVRLQSRVPSAVQRALDECLGGAVAAAHQRTGGDEAKPELDPPRAQAIEDLGRMVFDHGMVARRRLQILPERDDVNLDRAQLARRRHHVVLALAQPQHDRGF